MKAAQSSRFYFVCRPKTAALTPDTMQRIYSFLLALLFSLASVAGARTVTDHMGRSVEVPDEIKSVAATNIFPLPSFLSLFLTENKIIGMHRVSMAAAESGLLGKIRPEVLKADTAFMQGNALNIESMISLHPDVVFVNAGDAASLKMLENAGIPAVSFSVNKWNYNVLETYRAWIALIDQVFPGKIRRAEAEKYAGDIEALVAERIPLIPAEKRKRILFLFQYDAKHIVTSGKNFFGEYWAAAAGGINVAEEIRAENSNAIVNMEQIYGWNPDVIFITNFTSARPDDLFGNKFNNWTPVKAVQDKAVYKMPRGIYRTYTPSADSPLALLWVAKTVYPEAFADIDFTGEVKKYYKSLFDIDLGDGDVAGAYGTEQK